MFRYYQDRTGSRRPGQQPAGRGQPPRPPGRETATSRTGPRPRPPGRTSTEAARRSGTAKPRSKPARRDWRPGSARSARRGRKGRRCGRPWAVLRRPTGAGVRPPWGPGPGDHLLCSRPGGLGGHRRRKTFLVTLEFSTYNANTCSPFPRTLDSAARPQHRKRARGSQAETWIPSRMLIVRGLAVQSRASQMLRIWCCCSPPPLRGYGRSGITFAHPPPLVALVDQIPIQAFVLRYGNALEHGH